ncbi:hypothetical protein SPI_02695 [Niveomyces insectorum RCEF 264]|uniref:DUF7730 domain-containing protein n=1 Tax=Niveomyces insectorum RCEF 264 TaxID=1081102 RepID=A0A162KC50_9HYPO|nr:hypothetical protein SPI_02695 [Niveomyces insectorum RCEF 264]
MASSLSPSRPNGFFSLPPEIRLQIYDLCIPHGLGFFCDELRDMYGQHRRGKHAPVWNDGWSWHKKSLQKRWYRYPGSFRHRRSAFPAILLICRRMTDEVETELYSKNVFAFGNFFRDKSGSMLFSASRLSKMRKIVLHIDLTKPFSDVDIQQAVFSNLSEIDITVTPRSAAWSLLRSEKEPAKVDMVYTMMRVLRFVARTIPQETRIVVDAQKRMVPAFKTLLPGRCEFRGLCDFRYKIPRLTNHLGTEVWDD